MVLSVRVRIFLRIIGILFVLPFGSLGFGQVSSGVILGTASDTSGALIPGISITVANQGTNQVRETVTNEAGNYRVEPLQPGRYTVAAELPGFRKEVRSNVQVDVDARVRIDFQMQVGGVNEVIEVVGAAPVVQSDDSQIGQVIEQRKIEELPLNGRNFSQLAYISPGAFAPRQGSHLQTRGGFVAAGLEEKTNQFLLDGVNNAGAMTMEPAFLPNVDAIGEFKVQTQNYGAQYGRYAGAQVDAITKSGTNNFHGTLFAFTRNDNLDARNFFDPWPLKSLPEFKRHQYGGVLGGPIIHDTLFFFAAFQGQRNLLKQTTQPTVPFPEYWSGDLSRLNKVIRDPLTAQPFPNNRIPRERIGRVPLHYQSLIPLPIRNTLVNNAQAIIPIAQNYAQPTVKINYTFRQRHQIVGSYNLFDSPQNLEWEYAGSPEIPGQSVDGPIKNQLISLQYVWSPSSTLINELRAGLSRVTRDRRNEVRNRNYTSEWGIPGEYTPLVWGYPTTTITSYSQFGAKSNVEPLRVDGNFSVYDTVSKQLNNHALKVGGDILRQYARYMSIGGAAFNFTGFATGDAFADFLLGYPATTSRKLPLAPIAGYPRRWSSNWFIQDDWKVRRNLTINAGLRYELTYPLDEKFDRLAAFDHRVGNGRGGLRVQGKAGSHRYRDSIEAFKGLYPGLLVEYSDRFYKIDKNNFAPRLGVAWTPGSRAGTVVRAGYGIFYTLDDLCFCAYHTGVPFLLNQRFTSSNRPSWENPWPTAIGSGTINANGIAYNLVNAYYGHWNLGVQRELPGQIVLDVSYVGKKGTKIDADRDVNQPINGVKPYPLFGPVNYLEPRGSSIYHGLQTRFERRSSSGATILVSYMWGKLISNDNRVGNAQDSYNLRLERGLAQEDMRHRMTTSLIYQLPFGRDQRFLNSASGVTEAMLGGWELSGIIRANSGSPVTPTLAADISGTGRPGTDRPNLIGNPKLSNPSPTKGWWNPKAFAVPPRGTFGNAGSGTLTGPGFYSADISLMKRFTFGEGRNLQFRWEVFNALNHANFYGANSVADNSRFGTTGFALPSRQMQLGLKFGF